jgi:hypothetical protein
LEEDYALPSIRIDKSNSGIKREFKDGLKGETLMILDGLFAKRGEINRKILTLQRFLETVDDSEYGSDVRKIVKT